MKTAGNRSTKQLTFVFILLYCGWKEIYITNEYENASNSERLLSGCAGFFTLLSFLFLFMNIVFS